MWRSSSRTMSDWRECLREWSAHGVRYVADFRYGRWERLLWLLLVACSFGGLLSFGLSTFQQSENNPMVTTQETVPIQVRSKGFAFSRHSYKMVLEYVVFPLLKQKKHFFHLNFQEVPLPSITIQDVATQGIERQKPLRYLQNQALSMLEFDCTHQQDLNRCWDRSLAVRSSFSDLLDQFVSSDFEETVSSHGPKTLNTFLGITKSEAGSLFPKDFDWKKLGAEVAGMLQEKGENATLEALTGFAKKYRIFPCSTINNVGIGANLIFFSFVRWLRAPQQRIISELAKLPGSMGTTASVSSNNALADNATVHVAALVKVLGGELPRVQLGDLVSSLQSASFSFPEVTKTKFAEMDLGLDYIVGGNLTAREVLLYAGFTHQWNNAQKTGCVSFIQKSASDTPCSRQGEQECCRVEKEVRNNVGMVLKLAKYSLRLDAR